MDMPKPTAAHDRLKAFSGRWKGEERLSPSPWDPKGGIATGIAENRIALDGFALIQDYRQERGGAPSFQGHGVLSYDADGGTYQMHWFDSMGRPPNVYRGSFEGDVLRLTSALPGGFSRCSWDLGRPDEYRFLMEISQDGKEWRTMLEGMYRRSG